MIKISVITISKNQDKFIEKCIQSVINQNYENYEHIIIDANSTDKTHSILDKYKNKLLINIGNDEGPADGLNKGFLLAKGEIFYFLNADDFLLPMAFDTVSNTFTNNKELQLLICCGQIVDGHSKILNKVFPSFSTAKGYVNGTCTLFQQGLFFHSTLYKKTSGFNINNHISWDGELFMNFLLITNRKYIKRINFEVAAFRVHDNSISTQKETLVKSNYIQGQLFKKIYKDKIRQTIFLRYFHYITQIILDPVWFFYKIKNKLKYNFTMGRITNRKNIN